MGDADPAIDWQLTTWEGSRRAQLRHALKLTLRERLEAAAGLAEVARRFQEMRAKGKFKPASAGAGQGQGAVGVHQPSTRYDPDKCPGEIPPGAKSVCPEESEGAG